MSMLHVKDLKLLTETLGNNGFCDTDWFELGLELGLSYSYLKSIEASSNCLPEMLTHWLTSASTCTWEMLASALESMNQIAIAKTIRKICDDPVRHILQRYDSRLFEMVIPSDLVQLLYSEGLVKEQALSVNLMGEPLKEVYSAIFKDHNKFIAFSNILLKSKDSTHMSLAKDMLNDYESIRSSCSEDEPVESISLATISPKQTECYISQGYRSNFDEVRGEYGILLHRLFLLIEHQLRSEQLCDVKHFVAQCFPEVRSNLEHATSITEVMSALESRCNIINITPFEMLAGFFQISEAKTLIREYQQLIDQFCHKLKLNLTLSEKFFPDDINNWVTISFVLDWNPDDHTLDDIRRLLRKAFQDYACRIVVVSIRTGNSIIVTCYAPAHFTFLHQKLYENLSALKEFSLIRLIIGDCTIFDIQAAKKEEFVKPAEEKAQVVRTSLEDTAVLVSIAAEGRIEHVKGLPSLKTVCSYNLINPESQL